MKSCSADDLPPGLNGQIAETGHTQVREMNQGYLFYRIIQGGPGFFFEDQGEKNIWALKGIFFHPF